MVYRNPNKQKGTFKMVTCSQCGAEITKRSSKAVGKIPTNGTPAPTRVCKEGRNSYPECCQRKKKK